MTWWKLFLAVWCSVMSTWKATSPPPELVRMRKFVDAVLGLAAGVNNVNQTYREERQGANGKGAVHSLSKMLNNRAFCMLEIAHLSIP
eukprot:5027914-Amphidinium_carterae.1